MKFQPGDQVLYVRRLRPPGWYSGEPCAFALPGEVLGTTAERVRVRVRLPSGGLVEGLFKARSLRPAGAPGCRGHGGEAVRPGDQVVLQHQTGVRSTVPPAMAFEAGKAAIVVAPDGSARAIYAAAGIVVGSTPRRLRVKVLCRDRWREFLVRPDCVTLVRRARH